KTKTPNQEQNQIQSTSRTPLEKTLEADISIWRKTGHFYFALTDFTAGRQSNELNFIAAKRYW
ncbi:MAG: hypothetical protein WB995_09440, partial [Candidatus Acidiferrales bacterium]